MACVAPKLLYSLDSPVRNSVHVNIHHLKRMSKGTDLRIIFISGKHRGFVREDVLTSSGTRRWGPTIDSLYPVVWGGHRSPRGEEGPGPVSARGCRYRTQPGVSGRTRSCIGHSGQHGSTRPKGRGPWGMLRRSPRRAEGLKARNRRCRGFIVDLHVAADARYLGHIGIRD